MSEATHDPVTIRGRVLVAGDAEGDVLAADEPLSFWGGYDQTTGEIIDRRHPLSGANASGCVLVLPLSRGSSTTAAVFLEAVRRRTAPAAVITNATDRFLVLASIVADEMYGRPVPILSVSKRDFLRLRGAGHLKVDRDGCIVVDGQGAERR